MRGVGVKVNGAVDVVTPLDVHGNTPPEVRITPDAAITVGAEKLIYMADSFDPDPGDSIASYHQRIISQPAGSAVTLRDTGSSTGTHGLTPTHDGEYQVEGWVVDTRGAESSRIVRTFTASGSGGTTPTGVAGDWDTTGVEPITDGDGCLWVGTGSRTNGQSQTVSGTTIQGWMEKWSPYWNGSDGGQWDHPRVTSVSGKSWTTEIVPYNRGTGWLKGHQIHCDPPEVTWPTDASGREFAYMRTLVMFPDRFKCSGDMKFPDISGHKDRTKNYGSTGYNSNASGSFSAGIMTGYTGTRHLRVAEGGRLNFKHYLQADLGPYTYDASASGHNYWERIRTNPGNGTRSSYESQPRYEIPLGTGVWVEVIQYVRCNTANNRDGIYRIWIQEAGQARTLRADFTDMQWVASGASNLFLKFRSFWGGGSEDRPGWSRFGGPSVGDDTDLDEAPHFRDFWIGSQMPPMPRTT